MSELIFESGDSRYALSLDSGCNVFSWQCEGEELPYCPDGFPDVANGVFGGGNPLLFPAVGRTWDRRGPEPVADRFRLFGYDEPFSMPCHGYIGPGNWNTLDRSVTGEGVEARFEFEMPGKRRAVFVGGFDRSNDGNRQTKNGSPLRTGSVVASNFGEMDTRFQF